MRKVLFALLLTAVGLGLLLSFKSRTGAAATSALGGSALNSGSTSSAQTSAKSPQTSTSTPAGTPSASSSTAASNGKSASGTYTGQAENTEYGPVQVQAVLANGKLTDVNVLQVPDRGGYEDQIVAVALPQLKSEALSAQSANIDVVSGATYTSQGYAQSLQSALSQAGL